MTFEGVVRREHYAELTAACQTKVVIGRRGWDYAAVYLVPLIVLGFAFAIWADHAAVPPAGTAGFGPSHIALIALSTGLLGALLITHVSSRWQDDDFNRTALLDDGSVLGPRRVTLDTNGIALEGSYGFTHLKWPAIGRMTEAENTYLLWTDPMVAIMVPKDAFADAAQRAAFVAFVNERLGAQRKAPPPG